MKTRWRPRKCRWRHPAEKWRIVAASPRHMRDMTRSMLAWKPGLMNIRILSMTTSSGECTLYRVIKSIRPWAVERFRFYTGWAKVRIRQYPFNSIWKLDWISGLNHISSRRRLSLVLYRSQSLILAASLTIRLNTELQIYTDIYIGVRKVHSVTLHEPVYTSKLLTLFWIIGLPILSWRDGLNICK